MTSEAGHTNTTGGGVPEFLDRNVQTPYASGAIWYMQEMQSFSAWAGFDSAGPLTRHSSKRLMTPSSDMRCLDRLRKLHTIESFAVAKA